MKKQVKAARGPYGNEINVNINSLKELANHLQDAYDCLDEMDDDTFALADGEALINDLDTAIREVVSAIKFAKEGRLS